MKGATCKHCNSFLSFLFSSQDGVKSRLRHRFFVLFKQTHRISQLIEVSVASAQGKLVEDDFECSKDSKRVSMEVESS